MSSNHFEKSSVYLVFALCLLACGFSSGSDEESDDGIYAVSYDGNGSTAGSVPVDSYKYVKGESVKVQGNTGSLARTGYAFNGWNTLAAGTGKTYTQGSTFAMGEGDVRLYARWTTNPTFKVTYAANGATSGSVPTDTTNYEAGQTVTVLANSGGLVKAGAGFAGWNTASDGTGTAYVVGQTFNIGGSGVTLYARWGTEASWARSVAAGASISEFHGAAFGASGSVYIAGYQVGNGTYAYGSQSVAGASGSYNAVMVKYDAAGAALWARSVSAGSGNSFFAWAASDSSGNVYASGCQAGTGTYTYGSQSIAGTSGGNNAVLVKYDSSGTALWARTISAGSSNSDFYNVAADSSGNVYAAGYQTGTGTYSYGSQNAAGTAAGANAVLVKYNSSGTEVWARTVVAGTGDSYFYAVAADSSGNVYVAGSQTGNGTYTYGSQSAAGTSSTANVLLVKYDPSGNALWARTLSGGSSDALYFSVLAAGTDGVYAAGYQTGAAVYSYGSRSAAGTSSGTNVVLVKYDSSGTELWARSVAAGTGDSQYHGLAIDGSRNVSAAGFQTGTGANVYGTHSAAGAYSGKNVLLVKYDPSGTELWARTPSAGSSDSEIYAVNADAEDALYAAGYQSGVGTFTYGGESAAGTYSGRNAALVKWRP